VMYADRRSAGRALGERLGTEALPRPLVMALPRGGVPVGAEVATALHAPLDVVVARKIGAPGHPEYGIGAVTADGPPVFDRRALSALDIQEEDLAAAVEAQRREARRRLELYRGARPDPPVEGSSVVVVDDGLATGVTARAALRSLRELHPARLVLAAPVGAPAAARALAEEADDVVCLATPPDFVAVGAWYDDFDQLTDDEVCALLSAASGD
jgi:putative phosphoribosyl transferase